MENYSSMKLVFLALKWTVTEKSPMVSVVTPTMTISLILCVLAASSIILSISLKVAPDFFTTRIWPSKWTSRSKLLPISSVSPLVFVSILSVIGMLILPELSYVLLLLSD